MPSLTFAAGVGPGDDAQLNGAAHANGAGVLNGAAHANGGGALNGGGVINGGGVPNGAAGQGRKASRLRASHADDLHDLVCVGFGPASLAIAVALHDALEAGTLQQAPKVLFLEKQAGFAWHAGMLLPGAKMQISFVKDLATLRDPRSNFTFLNYLHDQGRLVEFTNLSTFLPARAEYEDYLRWSAGHFDDVVRYGTEVLSVGRDHAAAEGGVTDTFRVASRSVKSGDTRTYRAKNVLLAVGGQPSIPRSLPSHNPRVVHSSQYTHLVPKILHDVGAPYRVAVVGAGQSAAEIFNNIQTLYPNSRTWLVMRSEFLKPSDDSPFVNSIFNPEYVDALYPKSAKHRRNLLSDARSTNYGVVRLELIEALYERMYDQRRELGQDEAAWPHRIMGGYHVVAAEEKGDGFRLVVQRGELGEARPGAAGEDSLSGAELETLDVDLIVSATGYRRTGHLEMLRDVWPLLPAARERDGEGEDGADRWELLPQSKDANGASGTLARELKVSRDYRVQFAPGAVAPGSGVWLQGCCEATHGLSDTLLSVLATRSGEMVESIFGRGVVG